MTRGERVIQMGLDKLVITTTVDPRKDFVQAVDRDRKLTRVDRQYKTRLASPTGTLLDVRTPCVVTKRTEPVFRLSLNYRHTENWRTSNILELNPNHHPDGHIGLLRLLERIFGDVDLARFRIRRVDLNADV